MMVFEYRDASALRPRAHPWSHTDANEAHRYVNFRLHPERIRSSIEDLTPFVGHPAIETFYALLEWLNGPASVFESNDCAFNGVDATETPGAPGPFECSGRVMFLFRDLVANTAPSNVADLCQTIARRLSGIETDFQLGAVAATAVSVRFTTLAAPPDRQWGHQVMVSFWAWGDHPTATLDNLDRTLRALSTVLRDVSDDSARRSAPRRRGA